MAPSLSLFTRRKTSTAAAATAADDRALRAALSSPSFAHPPPTSAGSTASAEDFTRPGSGSHSPASAPATTKTKLPKTPLSAAAFGIPGGLYSPGFFGQSLGSATRTRTMTAAVDHPSASLARSNSDVSSTHRRSGSLDVRLPASWSRSERDREQKPPPPRKSYTSPALAPPSSPPRIPTSGSSGSNSPVGGMSAGRAAGKKRKDNVPGLPPHPSPVVSTSNAVVGHHHHHNNHHHHMPQSAPSTPGMPLSGGGPRKVSLPMLPMSPPLSPDSPGAGSGSAGLMKRSERELMLEIASLKQVRAPLSLVFDAITTAIAASHAKGVADGDRLFTFATRWPAPDRRPITPAPTAAGATRCVKPFPPPPAYIGACAFPPLFMHVLSHNPIHPQ